jgi:DNA-binding HxlR family transcriptional regulator
VPETLSQVLTVLGDRWALLAVREISLGLRRFDEIQAATGAPRQVLTDRIHRLASAGILTTRSYQLPGQRNRNEYLLTDAGIDLLPVLAVLSDWGARHLTTNTDPEIVYRHRGCGARVTATMHCECGEQIDHHRRLVAEVNR